MATLDEALELRAAGCALPILVLYPIPPSFVADAARERIAASVGDRRGLRRLLDAAADAASGGWPALDVQLEVETGLGRGGVPLAEVAEVAALLAAAPGVRHVGTWTHLANPGSPATTGSQVEAFGRALDALAASGIDPGARHLAASGGVLAGVPVLDVVRPGLSVYGIVPDDFDADPGALVASGLADRLRPVLALRARPVRVERLAAGAGVSYGPTWRAVRDSLIATLPIGYGDGWSRALSNRAGALVRGVRVPLVGNVAMDATMADVTDVPGPPVTIDDECTLIGAQDGAQITVRDVAQQRNTNPWEVTTSVARRVPRVYHAAAGPVGVRTLTSLEIRWPGSSFGTATSATSKSTRS